MPAKPDWDPLTGPLPTEVPLPDAPLIRVIAQLRFPTIAAIERIEAVAPFQEAMRDRYPVLREEKTLNVAFGPGGMQQPEPQRLWRFAETATPTQGWTVALTNGFLALEATKYTSRHDFMSRFSEALTALGEVFRPSGMDRLGVRYIDRIQGVPVANISALVRTDILGIAALAIGAHAHYTLTDTMFSIDGAHLHARWGKVPPKSTIDPTAINPVDDESWLLDLDAFTEEKAEFDVAQIVGRARGFAERIYAFFRWAVTDEFLRHFGGKP